MEKANQSIEGQYYTVCQAGLKFTEEEFRKLPTRRRWIYLLIAEHHEEAQAKAFKTK